jgi:hypothetical protein
VSIVLKSRDGLQNISDIVRSNWIILAIGAAIVGVAPFDAVVSFVTDRSVVAREIVITVLGLVGLLCADKVRLGVSSVGLKHPFLMPLTVGAAVALWVVIIDCLVFREILPARYVDIFRSNPVGARLLYFMMRAFLENTVYRLFLMTFLVWILGYLWRTKEGRPANGAYWTAMTLAQITNIGINVVAQLPTATPLSILYDGLRFVVPGMVWGYLYWHHGFVTAEIASIGAHPFLQPPLGYLLG